MRVIPIAPSRCTAGASLAAVYALRGVKCARPWPCKSVRSTRSTARQWVYDGHLDHPGCEAWLLTCVHLCLTGPKLPVLSRLLVSLPTSKRLVGRTHSTYCEPVNEMTYTHRHTHTDTQHTRHHAQAPAQQVPEHATRQACFSAGSIAVLVGMDGTVPSSPGLACTLGARCSGLAGSTVS